MKKSEIKQFIESAKKLTDEELENKYYNSVYDSLGSQIEEMYELGYSFIDIEERAKYEEFMRKKCDLLEKLCIERKIKLWGKV